MKLYAYSPFCNEQHTNVMLMWSYGYLENTIQLKFGNSVELTHVMMETLKIRVNTKFYTYVGELISKSPVPNLGGTCRILNKICRFLRAVKHSLEST